MFEAMIIIVNVAMSSAALAIASYVLRVRDNVCAGYIFQGYNRPERQICETLRELFRAKLITGGNGKHHAYHITQSGRVLVVDAADMQLAVVAGYKEFWDFVEECAGHDAANNGANALSVSLDEIDFGDGKGDFTYIRNGCGEAFVDGLLAFDYSAYSDCCARTTAEYFKNAVINAQAEAAERNRSRDGDLIHGRIVEETDEGRLG